jgi:cytochrome c peroxidase
MGSSMTRIDTVGAFKTPTLRNIGRTLAEGADDQEPTHL